MGLVRYLAGLLFIIAVPVALVTTTVRILANEPRVYEYAIDEFDATQTTGIARDELLRAGGELRDYFNNDEDEIFVRVEKDGAPIRLFTDRETIHLRDVKTLMTKSFRVQEAAVIFVLAYVVAVFIWARESSLRVLAKQLLLSVLLSLAIIGGVGVFFATGFDQSFDQFHRIAFDNDFWQLDPSRHHLIQMFPEAFWEDAILWGGLAALAQLGALALLSATYLGLTRRSAEPHDLTSGQP